MALTIEAIAVVHRDHQELYSLRRMPPGHSMSLVQNAIVLYEYEGERRQTNISVLLPESFQL